MLSFDKGIALFSLIFMRMTGCLFFNPFFGRRNIPARVRNAIILVLTLFVYWVTPFVDIEMDNVIGYSTLLLKELAVGYFLGVVFNFFLSSIIFAGTVIDNQMGLSMATVYDPQSNASISVSANLLNIIFSVLFFVTDSHLILLRIFLSSAEIIPYGSVSIGANAAEAAVGLFVHFMALIVKLAMPFIAIGLFLETGVGILMKTIPQINIFVVSIQAKILVGLVIILLLFSPLTQFLIRNIDVLMESLLNILKSMTG